VEPEQKTTVWPWIVMAIAGLQTFVAAMTVPPDAVQQELSRILYVHVPAAWLAYAAFLFTMFASAMYLWRRDLKWDRRAMASAEVGVMFTGLVLALGMIWAKPTWGVWWTWDARVTLTAILFFVYLGYLALRRTTDSLDVRAKRSAIFGIFAVVQIPVIHFSVVWWRGLHQAPSLLKPESPEMDTAIVLTLLFAVANFTAIYIAMMFKRVELARLEDELLLAQQSHMGPVAGEGIAAPDLTGGS